MRPEAATTAAGTAAAAAAKPAPAPEAKKKPAKKRMGVSAEAGGADDDLEEVRIPSDSFWILLVPSDSF